MNLKTRTFLVGPETFGLKLLVSILVPVPKFELPAFVSVPIFELYRTSWFRSGSWKHTFVCSLPMRQSPVCPPDDFGGEIVFAIPREEF